MHSVLAAPHLVPVPVVVDTPYGRTVGYQLQQVYVAQEWDIPAWREEELSANLAPGEPRKPRPRELHADWRPFSVSRKVSRRVWAWIQAGRATMGMAGGSAADVARWRLARKFVLIADTCWLLDPAGLHTVVMVYLTGRAVVDGQLVGQVIIPLRVVAELERLVLSLNRGEWESGASHSHVSQTSAPSNHPAAPVLVIHTRLDAATTHLDSPPRPPFPLVPKSPWQCL